MATTSKAFIPVVAAALTSVALASCGGDADTGAAGESNAAGGTNVAAAPAANTAQATPLFADNFKGVCSGASVSAAAAYDSAATTHKALYFETYRDDFMDRSSSLPDDWTVQFSPDGDAFRAVDLVVCARRTAARQVRICDQYQNKGSDTQNTVRWHTATYQLSVREARTGRQLAETTVEATDSECPMFMMFDSDSATVDGYASPSDSAVADFLRPHITR